MVIAVRFDARIRRQMMLAAAAIAVGWLFVSKPAVAQTTTTWTTCAQENQLCAFTGTRTVRYGANSSWVSRTVAASGGGIQCSNAVFGDPAPMVVKTCQLQNVTTTTTTSTSWPFCANENSLCAFSGTRNVRYGADTRWVTRSVSASGGGVLCSNAVFGDPAYGSAKTCQLEPATTTTTPTTTTTTGWAFCANENTSCAFTGTRRVRYGAGSTWVTRDLAASNGGISCSNATFGDPVPNVVKRCDLATTTSTTTSGTTNQPPTISGAPATSATVGMSYSFRPTASDPNGNTLAFSIANRPSWATFNTTNGALTGAPTLANVGNYPNIVISVSDGASSVSLPAFAINVTQNSAGTASLSWTPPLANSDGTSLTNLVGYRIYYGTSSTALTQQIQIASAGVSSYVISGLNSGTYYFAVRAYNSSNVESPASNLVMKSIP